MVGVLNMSEKVDVHVDLAYHRSIRILPSRDTITDRVAEPRVRWMVALESPRVRPMGEKVNWRSGPIIPTLLAAGPDADQTGAVSPERRMLSSAVLTESTTTVPRASASSLARW
jgi:hypothetical protein